MAIKFNFNTSSYSPALLNPPGDLYPFIEYDDIPGEQRYAAAQQEIMTLLNCSSIDASVILPLDDFLAQDTTSSTQDLCDYVQKIVDDTVEKARRIQAGKESYDFQEESKIEAGGGKGIIPLWARGAIPYPWLLASPPEIDMINNLIRTYGDRTGQAVRVKEYVKPFTVGWIDGLWFRPIKPGQMPNSIVINSPTFVYEHFSRDMMQHIYHYDCKIVKMR